jgi:hypothetical protein
MGGGGDALAILLRLHFLTHQRYRRQGHGPSRLAAVSVELPTPPLAIAKSTCPCCRRGHRVAGGERHRRGKGRARPRAVCQRRRRREGDPRPLGWPPPRLACDAPPHHPAHPRPARCVRDSPILAAPDP